MKSNKILARRAGFVYLLVVICGMFAELVIRDGFIVMGDAAATAANISTQPGLFRMGILADLLMATFFLMLPVTLYPLMKRVNRGLAKYMVTFVAASVPILCLNMLNQTAAITLLSGADFLHVFTLEQQQALALLFLNFHSIGYMIAQIFYGLWLLPLAMMILRSNLFPKFLGVLLLMATASHLTDFVLYFTLPVYPVEVSDLVMVPSGIGELIFCFWILIMGAKNVAEEKEQSL